LRSLLGHAWIESEAAERGIALAATSVTDAGVDEYKLGWSVGVPHARAATGEGAHTPRTAVLIPD
jgi:hypothetical protein